MKTRILFSIFVGLVICLAENDESTVPAGPKQLIPQVSAKVQWEPPKSASTNIWEIKEVGNSTYCLPTELTKEVFPERLLRNTSFETIVCLDRRSARDEFRWLILSKEDWEINLNIFSIYPITTGIYFGEESEYVAAVELHLPLKR